MEKDMDKSSTEPFIFDFFFTATQAKQLLKPAEFTWERMLLLFKNV